MGISLVSTFEPIKQVLCISVHPSLLTLKKTVIAFSKTTYRQTSHTVLMHSYKKRSIKIGNIYSEKFNSISNNTNKGNEKKETQNHSPFNPLE